MKWRKTQEKASAEIGQKGFDDFDVKLGDLMRGERATLGKSLLDVQRELKIKASYIAAIENADLSAFESTGFVAGFVRSYARYLGMDPDRAFAHFCHDANFQVPHGLAGFAGGADMTEPPVRYSTAAYDPLVNANAAFLPKQSTFLSRIEPGALGSMVVLVALVGVIGFGGWSVLREVQKVQLAPVDQAPVVVAEVDPLVRPANTGAADTVAAADPSLAANRLYRPQALDTPVLTSRDGPIAAIDPSETGALAGDMSNSIASAVDAALADVQVVADAAPGVELIAVRPSWVQVTASDGTVLFEKILDAGERWAVPALEEAPVLRAGNSGAVYFAVNGVAYGPAAPGAQVVKGVSLAADTLAANYTVADLTADPDLAAVVNVADASDVIPATDAPAE